MVSTLTKAALQLEPNERLELAQRLIESVRVIEEIEPVLTLSPTEQKDLKTRLETAERDPLSGRDLQGLLIPIPVNSLTENLHLH